MAKVEVYSGSYCPYCVRAKELLTRKGVSFTEYEVDKDMDLREQMMKRAPGYKTIPQIFINDQYVGGCDDLYALDRAGKLDGMLAHG